MQAQAQDSRSAARLTALYESHATDVFRYALHLTGRREDAEDVVQFVFLQAFATLEAGTELVYPRAWLIKAAKRRSLNLLRDRREARMAGHDLPVAAHDQPDPEEAEALAAVRSTLWALPESQHQAFVLRHWSGLSQDEIADVLDTTSGAVESLLIRARRTLLEDQNQVRSECSRVRNRLVQALAPTSGEKSHIASCRRCRTAQARLLRASEFASALALVPHPWVAHALGSAVPGFGTGSAAAATTTVTGAVSSGGAGAGLTAASAAAKVGLIAKVSLAAATAVVALGVTTPVRNTVSGALFDHRPAHSEGARTHATTAGDRTGLAPWQPSVAAGEPGQGAAAAGGGNGTDNGKSATAGANGQGSGKSNGKSTTAGANGQGSGKANGKSTTAGANGQGSGKSNGKSTTAGANGQGSGKSNGKSATAGADGAGTGAGQASGKPATAGANGQGGGKPA